MGKSQTEISVPLTFGNHGNDKYLLMFVKRRIGKWRMRRMEPN